MSASGCRSCLSLLTLLMAVAAQAAGDFSETPMDVTTARAMLNRFGFGATPSSLRQTVGQTPQRFITKALNSNSTVPESTRQQLAALPITEPLPSLWQRLGPGQGERSDDIQRETREIGRAAVQGRLLVQANSDNPGHEALLHFWLNHFSIHSQKGIVRLLTWDYLGALDEAIAADSFEALLRASFYHPAMLAYLDNGQSIAPDSLMGRRAAANGKVLGINENLARELLELHSLGVDGGYTQNDVQALARIITGAGLLPPNQLNAPTPSGSIRRGLFFFDSRRHDFGEKLFLGEFFPAGQGIEEIDRALHLLSLHPATAQRLSRKLAERFLGDHPPARLVDAMSQAYLRSGGKISATLSPLIRSQAFADSLNAPSQFKEPVDFVLSAARAVCGDTPINNAAFLFSTLQDMGETPLMHTTPDGYPTHEADWLSPVAMAKRIRFAIGLGAERLPLAEAPANSPPPPAAGASSERGNPSRGTPCTIDEAQLQNMIGALPIRTQAAGRDLMPRERAALWLSGPDFMRR